jgi:hypothetical protein
LTNVSLKLPASIHRFSTNAGDAAILNTALASHLGVKPGDSILLRVQKPSLLSAKRRSLRNRIRRSLCA